MRKVFCLFAFFLFFLSGHSQELPEMVTDTIASDSLTAGDDMQMRYLKGRIVSIDDGKPLLSAHVVNLNSVDGTITDFDGMFELQAQVNDTIFISYIGYQ